MVRSLLTLFLILLSAVTAFGQFETAEVLGTVRDSTGSPVPGALVTLTNVEQNVQSTTNTDEGGNYDFFHVKAGRYTVTVESTGFSRFNATEIRVEVNARQRVDVSLQVAEITQSVDVIGAATVLENDSSEHGQVINTQQIVELPLNGRNYADLALLSTNVHRSPMSVLFAANGTPREAAFNVNGMRITYNNFLGWVGQ